MTTLSAHPHWRAAPKLVVFDCDGTLVDSQGLIHAALAASFEGEGFQAPTREEARRVVGLKLIEAVSAIATARGEELTEDAAERLKQGYLSAYPDLRRQYEDAEPLFPGTREVLERLRDAGAIIGMATGKSRRGVDHILDLHGLESFFDVIRTADDGPSKPHPFILQDAMAQMGVNAGETVVIGDTSFDIVMARQAGAWGIGVSWGYHPHTELIHHGADVVIEEFAALIPHLDEVWSI